MNPGRELDALVAEKVMGWEWRTNPATNTNTLWKPERGMWQDAELPHYSTDISAAWEVVEKLDWEPVIHKSIDNKWCCHDETACADCDFGDWFAVGETAPHAICLAALKAVGCELE